MENLFTFAVLAACVALLIVASRWKIGPRLDKPKADNRCDALRHDDPALNRAPPCPRQGSVAPHASLGHPAHYRSSDD